MADDAAGVNTSDMQKYLNLDNGIDTDVLEDLISMAEEDIMGNIDPTVDVSVYRGYKLFNQAVKVFVDFNYYNRGELATVQDAYPPSYLYMINGIRWKIRRAKNENSG
ncbi:hypothetical protein FC19_GL001442 [Liquorilactobacillus aquaticus DSM 21051]|uniref:DNA packaging protein n=1 Tax=Liquorilactobacillus aquaticus DSM 21051 TaxID=1423725 RepID=A0A0R2D5V9_9LACO|nr:hypothetical protein FC19_GL001442 [Liquorilactobacillus aquaticus DSM 21051]